MSNEKTNESTGHTAPVVYPADHPRSDGLVIERVAAGQWVPGGYPNEWRTVRGIIDTIIHRYASIGNAAGIGTHTRIESGASIGAFANVGRFATIGSGSHVGSGADIGSDARCVGKQDLITMIGVGTQPGTLTLYRTAKGIEITRGCFMGTLEQFMSRLEGKPEHDLYRSCVPALHAELLRRMTPLEGGAA